MSEANAERLESMLQDVLRALYQPIDGNPFSDLTVSQSRMVRFLHEKPLTASVLSASLGMSMSAVTQMAGRLESAGIVERWDDPSDRRSKIIGLSALGKQLMDERRRHRVARVKDILSEMEPVSQLNVISALEALRSECGRLDPTRSTRMADEASGSASTLPKAVVR